MEVVWAIVATLFWVGIVVPSAWSIINLAIASKNPVKQFTIAFCLALPVFLLFCGLILFTNWLLSLVGANPYYQHIRDGFLWIAGVAGLLVFVGMLHFTNSLAYEKLRQALGKASG